MSAAEGRSRGEPLKKQFFAGTRCPACDEIDRIRRCEDAAGTIWLECVACGHSQDITHGYVPPDEEEPASRPVQWKPG